MSWFPTVQTQVILWSHSSCVSLPLFIQTASTSIGMTSGVDDKVVEVEVVG